MIKISLTVNSEPMRAEVEPRTQLAAVLRNDLHLTGTHLSCEQGVCGACTVLVDDKPIRSCISYAAMFDGARIETIEGFRADPVMTALRRAFRERHALQCGFCTPGMLIAARDIVLRTPEPDEKRIRQELSGNICRCTGYVGIVRAIQDVIEKRLVEAAPAPKVSKPALAREPLRPFALAEIGLGVVEKSDRRRGIAIKDGWTSVERRIRLSYPPQQVWDFLADIRQVALCVPGASVKSTNGNAFTGEVAIRFGLIRAAFSGEGQRSIDEDARRGVIDARGRDNSGQSNVHGSLIYSVVSTADDRTADLDLQLRYQLKGLLAQFNRPDLVEGFLDVLLLQFASACSAALSGAEHVHARELSAFALLRAVIKQKLAAFFRKRAG